MAQSDFSPSAKVENKADTPKPVFPPCLQIAGGDGGGFDVAKGCLHTATGREPESSDFTTMQLLVQATRECAAGKARADKKSVKSLAAQAV